MKLSSSLFALSFILSGAISGVHGVTCQTSGGSPTFQDAISMAAEMSGNSGVACQDKNPGGSLCTEIWTFGTAAANLCGTFLTCVSFVTAARNVVDIASACTNSDNLAGGTSQIDDELRLDLFHT